jgi:hypothetical protein
MLKRTRGISRVLVFFCASSQKRKSKLLLNNRYPEINVSTGTEVRKTACWKNAFIEANNDGSVSASGMNGGTWSTTIPNIIKNLSIAIRLLVSSSIISALERDIL